MFNILVKFKGEDKFTDIFCPVKDIASAEATAKRWKWGAFTADNDAVEAARVVDKDNKVVFEI